MGGLRSGPHLNRSTLHPSPPPPAHLVHIGMSALLGHLVADGAAVGVERMLEMCTPDRARLFALYSPMVAIIRCVGVLRVDDDAAAVHCPLLRVSVVSLSPACSGRPAVSPRCRHHDVAGKRSMEESLLLLLLCGCC